MIAIYATAGTTSVRLRAGAGTRVPACRQFAGGAHVDAFLLPPGLSDDIAEISWFSIER